MELTRLSLTQYFIQITDLLAGEYPAPYLSATDLNQVHDSLPPPPLTMDDVSTIVNLRHLTARHSNTQRQYGKGL